MADKIDRDFSDDELHSNVSWESCLEQILENDPDYSLDEWFNRQEALQKEYGQRHKISTREAFGRVN